ncbi:unnamed protein product [Ilex paraguariensis]|uniref:Uncharacterized protein n=1 Tax=Ilex paraguariensis TaxID=185542 RepID=A0ABC8SGV9_9AQUA
MNAGGKSRSGGVVDFDVKEAMDIGEVRIQTYEAAQATYAKNGVPQAMRTTGMATQELGVKESSSLGGSFVRETPMGSIGAENFSDLDLICGSHRGKVLRLRLGCMIEQRLHGRAPIDVFESEAPWAPLIGESAHCSGSTKGKALF